MSDGELVLGLDVGTTSIKAVLVDRDGREVTVVSAATPFVSSSSGVEMAVDDLEAALTETLTSLGPARRRIVSVGIAGLAESGAPLDESGEVMAPIIAWHDPRGEETVARLNEQLGDRLPHRIGQRLRKVSSVAKLGWLLDHGCGNVHRWLGVPELCLWKLTGAQATEHSLASRTGCFDVTKLHYMPEVAEAAGFSPGVFAPVRIAGEPLGEVTPAGAALSGLPEGIPVTLAGHDHLAGAKGAGTRETDLANSVGTAETVLRAQGTIPDIGKPLTSARPSR